MNSYIPDVNLWLALTLDTHEHLAAATAWLDSLPEDFQLLFCRITQISFLRLLSMRAVAGAATMNQRQAWKAYDRWIKRGGAVFADEPLGIEMEFRALANQGQPAPNDFADSYLAAFANARSLELVTFDPTLSRRARRSVLLKPTPRT